LTVDVIERRELIEQKAFECARTVQRLVSNYATLENELINAQMNH